MVFLHRKIMAVAMFIVLFPSRSPAAEPVPAAKPVGPLASSQSAYVDAAAYSRDGKLLAVAQCRGPEGKREHAVFLFDTRTWKQLFKLTGPPDTCIGVVFSADGANLFAACTDGSVYAWDTKSGASGQKLDATAGACHSLVLSPDGRTLAAGYVDTGKEPARSSIGTWDAVTGKPIGTISPDVTILSNSLTFTPDSKRIVGGCVDPRPDKDFSGVIEWGVASGKEERRYDAVHVTPGGHSFAHAIRYTRDGKWLIIGGGETVSDPAFPNSSHLYGYVWLLDRTTGKLKKTLVERRHDQVRSLLLSPDEDRLYLLTHSIPRNIPQEDALADRTYGQLQCWDTSNWNLKWAKDSDDSTTDWTLIAAQDPERIGIATRVAFLIFDLLPGDWKGRRIEPNWE